MLIGSICTNPGGLDRAGFTAHSIFFEALGANQARACELLDYF